MRGYRLVFLDGGLWGITPQEDGEDVPGNKGVVRSGLRDALYWIEVQEDLVKDNMLHSQADVDGVLAEVGRELGDAVKKFDSFNTAHEGYAVILEELDELWTEVKDRHQDPKRMREEAKQVAAMAVRFMLDICGGPDAR